MLRPLRPLRLAGLVAAIAWTAATATGQPLPYQVIVKSGDQAPGAATGVTFASGSTGLVFFPPAVGPDGSFTFRGRLAGVGVTDANRDGLWSWSAGQLQLVARTGSPMPGTGTDPLQQINDPPASAAGGVTAFSATVTNRPAGIWAGAAGGLQPVALYDQPAPGTGGTFAGLSGWPLVTADGRVTFRSYVKGDGITPANYLGIWSGTPGNLQLAVRTGDAAPGVAGAVFSSVLAETMNAAGVTVYRNSVTGGGVTTANDEGIWTGPPGNLRAVMREGSTAPQTGGTVYDFLATGVLGSGQVMVSAWLFTGGSVTTANNAGLWVGTSAADLQLAVRKGDQVPGAAAGVSIAGNFYPTVNGDHLAFFNTMTGSGVTAANDGAMFAWSQAGGLRVVAREGDVAPGTGGAAFATLDPWALERGQPVPAADGSVVFSGTLTGGGVTAANDESLWLLRDGQLRLVAREGDVLDLDPGPGTDLATVRGLSFLGGREDAAGGLSPFDAQGGLAWTATFTDGRSAVFFTPVPEPAALLAVAAGGLLLTRLRRRASAD